MASSALNTPIMRPDIIKKAAIYCATLSLIDRHEAITTITVVKLVKRIKGTAKPSTPKW